jgi:hypothetical protein
MTVVWESSWRQLAASMIFIVSFTFPIGFSYILRLVPRRNIQHLHT